MFHSHNRQRVQWLIFLSGLALAAYYFFVYRPLAHTAAAKDRPLLGLWQQLVRTNAETRVIERLELTEVRQNLRQAQASLAVLDETRRTAEKRLALDPAYQAKLQEPFQLIDFQYERQLRIDDLTRLAKQRKIPLDPAVQAAYPKFTSEQDEPNLLWAQLGIVHQLLVTAIHCQASSIKSIDLPPIQKHSTSGAAATLHEISVQIELLGPMSAVAKFLSSLSLRSDELKSAGLPEASPGKPALFIERLLLRKHSPDKPDEVRLNATVCGFAFADPTSRDALEMFE